MNNILEMLVKSGKINAEDLKAAEMAEIREVLMNNNVITPKITERKRGGSTQFYCVMPAKYSKNGKRHQIICSTREECQRKFQQEAYNKITDIKDIEHMTISDLMEEWMAKKHDVKKQTLAGYHSHYENHIKNASFAKWKIKDIRLQECSDILADLIDFREKRKDGTILGLGYDTIRHIKSEISMAFDYAVAHEYITANYMLTVKINQGLCDNMRARESKAWTDEELYILHKKANETWEMSKKYRYSAVLMAMCFTGCRAGEFCALEWSDFNEKELWI